MLIFSGTIFYRRMKLKEALVLGYIISGITTTFFPDKDTDWCFRYLKINVINCCYNYMMRHNIAE